MKDSVCKQQKMGELMYEYLVIDVVNIHKYNSNTTTIIQTNAKHRSGIHHLSFIIRIITHIPRNYLFGNLVCNLHAKYAINYDQSVFF